MDATGTIEAGTPVGSNVGAFRADHSIGPGDGLARLEGHRVDVQALRGVAVLLVVLYHAEVLFPGGFVGVDVFFVISGFVIGRMLVGRLVSTGTVALGAFFERRIRRLLPALALMLTLVVLSAPLLAPIGAGDSAARTGSAAALFGANLHLDLAASTGYFASDAEWNPLLHTWSLSVEEQFYFVIPALLWVAWSLGRRGGRPLRGLRVVVGAMLVGSLLWCVAASNGPAEDVRFAFFSPFTRAWEFAAGIALALLPAAWLARRRIRFAATAIGAALVGFSAVTYSQATIFPGAAAIVPVLGTVLIIYGGTARDDDRVPTLPSRAVRPLVRLGDLSYGWYLWHWPVIVYAGAFWPHAGRAPLLVAAALSLVPAWMSTEWLERRLRVAHRAAPVPVVRLAAWCIVVPLIAAGLSGALGDRIADRSAVAAVAAPEPHAAQRAGCNSQEPLGARPPTACVWGDTDAATSVLLLGDSNADHFSETLIGAVERSDAHLRIATSAGCPVLDVVVDAAWFPDEGAACRKYMVGALDHLRSHPPDVVVVANATDKYLHSDEVVLVDPETGARAVTTAERRPLIEVGLRRAIATLRSSGSRVVILNVAPKPVAAGIEFDARDCAGLLLLTAPDRCAMPDFTVGARTAVRIEVAAASVTGAETWDFAGALCPRGRCVTSDHESAHWLEPEHLTVAAAESLGPRAAALLDGGPGD